MKNLQMLTLLSTLLLCIVTGYTKETAQIYLTTDFGHTWAPSNKGFPSDDAVHDFCIYKNIILAGTGANGIFISHDRGQNWQRADNGLMRQVNAIVSTHNAILAGTRHEGVFVSYDDGETWQPANNGLSNLEIYRMAIHDNRVFAGTSEGLFVTDDYGFSWKNLIGSVQIKGITILNHNIYVGDI